ncbi:MAG TPA: sulfatase-like hydrolase/transferase [Vicinamibacterales bacterium]|nr:sulfatase-like hydrolase/transferase [Vicinamibacterales bacterium]
MRAAAATVCLFLVACSAKQSEPPAQTSSAHNLVIITIDTLRADHLGAYGYKDAHTPTIDRLANDGVLFTHAYATAPITLTSHASLMTGRYPPGHGARHNGMRIDLKTPTLADKLGEAGFSTAAFIAAYPLDRRFGLIKGFQTYGDRMPPARNGRMINERPGRDVVDEALSWLSTHGGTPGTPGTRFFLWIHLFEPHAPYGDPADKRGLSARQRYDEEITEADRQVGRVVDTLAPVRNDTIIVVAADHGEAFGEHGEIGHSIFVYDTTLRVPLVITGPGVPAGRTVDDRVVLVDIAPTVTGMLGVARFDADGIDLRPAFNGTTLPNRALYAESFAPLLDFGWSPLHSLRSDRWKYIDAPKPELFDITRDPTEEHDLSGAESKRVAEFRDASARLAGPTTLDTSGIDPEAKARLQALGYAGGSATLPQGKRADPKDRKEEAARLAQVTSGELAGKDLERALRALLRSDPANPQANLRLGYVLLESNRCKQAIPRLRAAIAAHLPSADAHLGLAGCQVAERQFDSASATLRDAERIEPGNPVVMANLGLVLSDGGHPAEAIEPLQRALTIDPDLHQARFGLAVAFARAGRRADAASTAEELLRRLPPDASQRSEVERLIRETRRQP